MRRGQERGRGGGGRGVGGGEEMLKRGDGGRIMQERLIQV